MLKPITLLCLFLISTLCSQAQQVNLIQNPSFEEYNYCPTDNNEDFQVIINGGWFSPLGSADFFNPCALIESFKSPINLFGYQIPNLGAGYIGFGTGYVPYAPPPPYPNYYYNQLREIVGHKLKYKLNTDSVYTVGFYVSLADSLPFTMKNWGVMFSKDSVYFDVQDASEFPDLINEKFIYNTNSIKVDMFPDSALKDTQGWVKVEATFTATGGEEYMYIGNFTQHPEIQWENSPNFELIDTATCNCKGAYYYIDDVYLYGDASYKEPLGLNEQNFENINIYPNPTQDFVSIELLNKYTQAQLSIYNLTGQLVAQKQITSNQQILISELGNGMYIFVIQNGDKVIGRQRVVVAR